MADSWKQWEGTIVDGKFRLERFLGGSEHSVVFLTESDGGAKAAIKFVPAIPQALEAQRIAWEQSSRLSHPHLIRLVGSGKCRLGNLDVVYAVMEYAEDNVAQILPNRALSVDETRDLLKPVLDSLKYLHEKGFVHGSLKPSNVLAVEDQLKLSVDQVRTAGKAGLAADNSVYAAPEIAREGVGAPSDVWSLGVMLTEVLTQKLPEGSAAGPPVVPANLPEPFGEIVRRCLVLPPQDRWTIAQVTERLTGGTSPKVTAQSNKTPDAPPVPPAPARSTTNTPVVREPVRNDTELADVPAERDSGRNPLVSVISILLILLVLYAGYRFFHRTRNETIVSPPSAPSNETSNPPAPPPAPTSAPAPSSSAAPMAAPAETAAPSSSSARGQVLQRVEPNIAGSARASITGKIRVRINLAVDEAGKVSDAHFITPGPSKYFASRAMEAARRWTFTPPQVNGQPAASRWTLHFEFTRKGTESSAEENSP